VIAAKSAANSAAKNRGQKFMWGRPAELEPGMWFRLRRRGDALCWVGVDPVVSRFPNKRRVLVHVTEGAPFVMDREDRLLLIHWEDWL
jgi:hypothetical protein